MSEKITEDMLKEAELRRLNAQAERDNAERSRIDKEILEISERISQKWWYIRLPVLLQVVIAGIVAGALIGGFLLDHFLNISELIQQQQNALVEKTKKKQKQWKISEQKLHELNKQYNEELSNLKSGFKKLQNKYSELAREKQKWSEEFQKREAEYENLAKTCEIEKERLQKLAQRDKDRAKILSQEVESLQISIREAKEQEKKVQEEVDSRPKYRTVKYTSSYGNSGVTSIPYDSEYVVYDEWGCGGRSKRDILKIIVHKDGTIQAYNKDCASSTLILGPRTENGCSTANYKNFFFKCCATDL